MIRRIILVYLIYVLSASLAYSQSVPSDVKQKLQRIYANKYPNNPSLQETLIRDQIESYLLLQRWKSAEGVPKDKFKELIEIYKLKYPNDYSMQKTLIQYDITKYLMRRK